MRQKYNFNYAASSRDHAHPNQDKESEIGKSKLTNPFTISTEPGTAASGGLNTLSEPLNNIKGRNSIELNIEDFYNSRPRLPMVGRAPSEKISKYSQGEGKNVNKSHLMQNSSTDVSS